ncbi:glycosyltransferase involved in cell wall biosynthesis [Agrococcus sp. UYP33]
MAPRYSIVIPVYKNEETIPNLFARLRDLSTRWRDLEVVLVVDGSPDRSADVIRAELTDAPFSVQLVEHSRNFGSFEAIRSGLAVVKGDYVGVMAADLQEPTSLVEEFFTILEAGDWDVAVGTRQSRDDPGSSKLLSGTYWSLYRRLIQPEMPKGGIDIFGCTREVAARLVALEESHSSLVGLLLWVGYRRVEVPYARVAREHGKSGWSLRRKIGYFLDSSFSFTNAPITVITLVGILGTVTTIVIALTVFISWALGRIPVEGFTALMLVNLGSTGAILIALGVIGSYVRRGFDNSKRRPHAIVARATEFER